MKKIMKIAIVFLLLFTACGKADLTWEEHYDLGMRYLTEGNYEKAILSFTAAIEIDAKRIEAYIGRGDAYFAFEELEDHYASAIADYEAVLGLDEQYVDAYMKLADIYIVLDETEKVITNFEKVLELDEQNVDTYLKLAEIYFEMGDEESAIDILKKGVKLTNNERLKNRLAEEGHQYISDVEAIIIVNEKEYIDEMKSMETTYGGMAWISYGIRFSLPILTSDEAVTIDEMGLRLSDECGLSWDDLEAKERNAYDDWHEFYNWEYLDKRMIVSGYITVDENYQRYFYDEEVEMYTLDPNGAYDFLLANWRFAE